MIVNKNGADGTIGLALGERIKVRDFVNVCYRFSFGITRPGTSLPPESEFPLVLLNSIVYSSHARHVSTWLIVPASYDQYTVLVKGGNVASKRLESSLRNVSLVETWIP